MRLVSLFSPLPPGAVLGYDVHIPGSDGPPLLRRGVELTARYVEAMKHKGIVSVYVEDALSEGSEVRRAITPETQHRAVNAVSTALSEASEALISGRGLSPKAVDELNEVAQLIALEVHGSPDVALHLADMMGADKYLLQHVVDVTALGTVLAGRLFRQHGWIDHLGERRRDRVDPRLAKIALGLLLHDIGKLAIPPDILLKEGPLTDEEWVVMRRHPQLGADLLGEHMSFLIRAVVKQHHERWDGTGYPDGLAGEDIPLEARIVATADAYVSMTEPRPHRPARTHEDALEELRRVSGSQLDPQVVDALLDLAARRANAVA
jgi:HD-GYP domain-containing protein (c-di-GMP phosphodiesterase class II)